MDLSISRRTQLTSHRSFRCSLTVLTTPFQLMLSLAERRLQIILSTVCTIYLSSLHELLMYVFLGNWYVSGNIQVSALSSLYVLWFT
jgi:hypothetical protein